jgi:hypothetical protein
MPPTPARVHADSQNIHIEGRPDWTFAKVWLLGGQKPRQRRCSARADDDEAPPVTTTTASTGSFTT